MKLKILAHEYAVVRDTGLRMEDDEFGFCDSGDCTIVIDDTISETMTKEVIIHEIVEAINFHLEGRLKHSQITLFSTALLQVMLDNKNLFRDYILVDNPDKRSLSIEVIDRKGKTDEIS